MDENLEIERLWYYREREHIYVRVKIGQEKNCRNFSLSSWVWILLHSDYHAFKLEDCIVLCAKKFSSFPFVRSSPCDR